MHRLLLVEDDAAVGRRWVQALEPAGFRVTLVTSVGSAHYALENDFFAAIVVDANLPDTNVDDICTEIRAVDLSTPLVAVPKPCRTKELVGLLQTRIEERQTSQFLTLQVDRRTASASLDGQPLTLVDREFDVLAFLVENGGRAVARERLLQRLDRDGEISEAAFDAQMASLQQKLAQRWRVALISEAHYRLELAE